MRRFDVILTSFAALLVAATPALADETPRTVSVTGESTIVVAPDAAEISAGVVSVGATATEALADNSKRMNAVFDGLKALGIAERELRTSNFSISPAYARQPRDSNEPPAITGYRVNNMVHARLRDVTDTGRVIDRLVTLGANSIANVQFVVSDRQERQQAALADAVRDARARAELMAVAAGARVGPVLSLSESSAPGPRPVFAMKAMAESAAPPIAGGEETLQITVQATFALE